MRRGGRRDKDKAQEALRQLSVDLSYCLPVEARADFIKRFGEGAADVLGFSGPDTSVPIGA